MLNMNPIDSCLYPQTTRSSSLLTTLPSLSKVCSQTAKTFRSEPSKFFKTRNPELIEKLRTRKILKTTVTPFIAAETIRKYFIPMFSYQRKQRSRSFKRSEGPKLTLSEYLEAELIKSQDILSRLNLKLKAIQADKLEKTKEIEKYQKKILNFQSSSKCLAVDGDKTNIFRKSSTIRSDFIKHFHNMNANKEKISEMLCFERIKNVELKDKANEMKHWNSLLSMQSEIMGERLKGLYFSYISVFQKSLESSSYSFLDKIHESLEKLLVVENFSLFKLNLITIEVKKYRQLAIKSSYVRKTVDEEVKKSKYIIKYKIESINNDISRTVEEKEKISKKSVDFEKKSNNLESEYDKMLVNFNKINQKLRIIDDLAEKICKHCNSAFYEKENFNWSCRVHASEWSSANCYWCCGAKKREALGCISSKHISNETEAEAFQETGNRKRTLMRNTETCTFCKKIGHDVKNCEKDPNSLVRGKRTNKKLKTVRLNQTSINKLEKFKDLNYLELKTSQFEDIDLLKEQGLTNRHD